MKKIILMIYILTSTLLFSFYYEKKVKQTKDIIYKQMQTNETVWLVNMKYNVSTKIDHDQYNMIHDYVCRYQYYNEGLYDMRIYLDKMEFGLSIPKHLSNTANYDINLISKNGEKIYIPKEKIYRHIKSENKLTHNCIIRIVLKKEETEKFIKMLSEEESVLMSIGLNETYFKARITNYKGSFNEAIKLLKEKKSIYKHFI